MSYTISGPARSFSFVDGQDSGHKMGTDLGNNKMSNGKSYSQYALELFEVV